MWVLALWVWLAIELPLTNSLVEKPLEQNKNCSRYSRVWNTSPAVPTFLRKRDYGKLRGNVKCLSEG